MSELFQVKFILIIIIILKIINFHFIVIDEQWTASSEDIEAVRQFASTNQDIHATALFCTDTSLFGTIGIAYLNAVCSSTTIRVSINEDGRSAARTADVNIILNKI